jgi:hypothetical protein
MIKMLVALGLAGAALVQPAQAQELWRHGDSGVSLPRKIGDMALGAERDLSGGGNHDVILQYGDEDVLVTVYVYRSAFPNAALWFERTRLAMGDSFASNSVEVAPRRFTLGGGGEANGLREEFDLPQNNRNMRATAVAMAQLGEWMVKARITARTLDKAGVAARMDQLLGAIRFSGEARAHPLLVPGACPENSDWTGTDLGRNPAGVAAAIANGRTAAGEARGRAGLAADPASWCRMATEIPVQYGTLYRARDGSGFVALMGDSGQAIAGHRFAQAAEGAGAATYVTTPSATSLAAVYAAMPNADRAVIAAVPVLSGQLTGLGNVRER